MIYKTKGIVFRFTRFKETSIIVTIFTELFGVQAYIVNGARSSKSSGNKMALFQPLTLLDLVIYHRENANINRIKEVKCLYPSHSLSTDIKKAALCMFISEIINKAIKEESHAKEIFNFLLNTLLTLDHQVDGYENFHLVFLLKLSRYLGFGAHAVAQITGSGTLAAETEDLFENLMRADYTTSFSITPAQRREILDLLLRFYTEHIETFGEIKSVQVLRDVLS
jgi:DNA repair protein RecO (recombination protein O)